MSDDLGLSFPILSDTERSLTKTLGVYDPANDVAWPAVYVIGPSGVIEWREVAASYVLEKRPSAAKLLDVVKGLNARPQK